MFNRISLKNNAKIILRKNYLWVVLVTAILSLTYGGFTMRNSQSSTNEESNTTVSNSSNEFGNISPDADINEIMEEMRSMYMTTYNEILYKIENVKWEDIAWIVYTALIIAIVAMLISIFVFAPIRVGCRRWYLLNRTTKPDISEVIFGFKNGYTNIVKTKFLMNLFIALWSMLFVIPGIIKSYEYRMIPYLLAENPNMDYREAFDRSRTLMNGNKWDAFVLDMSFFGWYLLSLFTLGIINLLYIDPYVELTNTELYVCLCQGREKYEEQNNHRRNPYDDYKDKYNNQFE